MALTTVSFTQLNTKAMDKRITAAVAASKIKDGMTVMVGGFLGNGTPESIVDALVQSGVKDLTLILNDTAYPDRGAGKLIVNKQVKKIIVSHIGTNPETANQMNAGTLEVEFSPQGTLAERIRCGGCGLGGALTTTGLDTIIEKGKRVIEVEGKKYLLELPLRADVAIIRGSVGDTDGNLIYRGTSQNFCPLMAMAADVVIAEIGDLKKVGEISPEAVHTPSIFVDYIVA